MIYEEEENNDTFLNGTNTFVNGNNNDFLHNDSHQKSSPVSLTQNKMLIKKSFIEQCHPTTEKKSTSNQFLKSKKEQCNGDLNSKNNIEKMTASVIDDSIISPVKMKTPTSCTRCAEISNIVQDLDEGNNARNNIKRLKKLIASRREDFFFGNDSMSFSYSTSSK